MWIDFVENLVARTLQWTKLHRKMLHGALGLSILFYGSHFSNLVLLGHSFVVAGLPIIKQHGKELYDTFQRARNAIKSESSSLLQEGVEADEHIKKLLQLKSKINEAKKDYDDGKISLHQFQTISKELNAEISAINHILSNVSNSITVIKNAIDPKSLQVLLIKLYY